MEDILKQILSQNEAIVYTDLLNNGLSKPTNIAKRTKVPRNKVYDALYKLESKKLVFAENSKVKMYSLANPQKIMDMVNEISNERKMMVDEMQKLFPQIKSLYDANKIPQPYFQYTHGISNIIADIRKEISNTKRFVYVFSRGLGFFEDHNLITAYRHLARKGVDVRVITLNSSKAKSIAKRMGAKAIFIPEEFIVHRTMIVKENLFAVSLFGQHDGIRMKTESNELIDAFKSVFLLSWNIAMNKEKIEIGK